MTNYDKAWKTAKLPRGDGYEIYDHNNKIVGKYVTQWIGIAHHVAAIQEVHLLRRRLDRAIRELRKWHRGHRKLVRHFDGATIHSTKVPMDKIRIWDVLYRAGYIPYPDTWQPTQEEDDTNETESNGGA